MATPFTDETAWTDSNANNPPVWFELLDTDGRWWFAGGQGFETTVFPPGGTEFELEEDVTVNYEVAELMEAPHSAVAFEFVIMDEGLNVVFTETIPAEIGTGSFVIPSGTTVGAWQMIGYNSSFGYDGIVALEFVDGVVDPGPGPGDAAQPGVSSAIRVVERDVLDTFFPGWTAPPDTDPTKYDMYVLDAADPLAFWLFPHPVEGLNVVVTYAAIPPALATAEDELALSDAYNDPVIDYVVYRALSKDARGAAPGVAERYREKFLLALGANRQVMKATGQGASRPPHSED